MSGRDSSRAVFEIALALGVGVDNAGMLTIPMMPSHRRAFHDRKLISRLAMIVLALGLTMKFQDLPR